MASQYVVAFVSYTFFCSSKEQGDERREMEGIPVCFLPSPQQFDFVKDHRTERVLSSSAFELLASA